jgi:hypothetical protein
MANKEQSWKGELAAGIEPCADARSIELHRASAGKLMVSHYGAMCVRKNRWGGLPRAE